MKILAYDLAFLGLAGAGFAIWYLLRPLTATPKAADFTCFAEADGEFRSFAEKPRHIFGVGLAYANHIAETAQQFSPAADPLVFVKGIRAYKPGGGSVDYPAPADLAAEARRVEKDLDKKLARKFPAMDGLVDYEAELGFVLLEDVSDAKLAGTDFHPRLGFFIANDLSARSLQVLGEGMPDRMAYWGMSKSLAGFLPVSKKIWVPYENSADAIPCVTLQTRVNGELRQNEKTNGMIYTPLRILRALRKAYPHIALKKGDRVIMGTPGGIALNTPRWKARIAELFGFDRFKKLGFVLNADRGRFLKPGDTVVVSGEWLGEVKTLIRRPL